jgi:hypothetical protein
MPTDSEAVRLNLEYYRKQAKALLKAAHSEDPNATERIARYSPELSPMALHGALLTIAREQGFPSWPRFKAFIVQSGLNFEGLVTAFIEAALQDLRRAEEMLAGHPEVAKAGVYVALVLGDAERVKQALSEAPGLVNMKAGPRGWQPLLYVCFSLFANGKSKRAANLVETARMLLHHGADPNGSDTSEQWPANPLSCLYAATGLNNNPQLTALLLEAGANPNDSESLYHSTEHADLACMRLLLKHGAAPAGTNALKHMLDRESVEGLGLLLAAGADPNEVNGNGETALHWAIWRGRSIEVRLLYTGPAGMAIAIWSSCSLITAPL